jgi:clan AA aspartic protease
MSMGLVKTRISLNNPKDPSLSKIEIEALVNAGALHLCIPEHVAVQLQLQEIYKREVVTADGRRQLCAYVGPVQITFGSRGCFTGALVLGDAVLLGAVPMEDMDLIISPSRRTVEVNPESPNIPLSTVKGVRSPVARTHL